MSGDRGQNIGNRVFLDENYYILLGVSSSAKESEIQRAFRKLAPSFHPDKIEGDNVSDMFNRLEEAKRILLDPEFRRHYDDTRGRTDGREAFLNRHMFSLSSCRKLSDDVLANIKKFKEEFSTLDFEDNVVDTLREIFGKVLEAKKDLENLLEESENAIWYCSICGKNFLSEDAHFEDVIFPYVTYLEDDTNIPISVFEYLEKKLALEGSKNDIHINPSYASTMDMIETNLKNLAILCEDSQSGKNFEDIRSLALAIVNQLKETSDTAFVVRSIHTLIRVVFQKDSYSIQHALKALFKTFPQSFLRADFNSSDTLSTQFHEFFINMFMKDDLLENYRFALGVMHFLNVTPRRSDSDDLMGLILKLRDHGELGDINIHDMFDMKLLEMFDGMVKIVPRRTLSDPMIARKRYNRCIFYPMEKARDFHKEEINEKAYEIYRNVCDYLYNYARCPISMYDTIDSFIMAIDHFYLDNVTTITAFESLIYSFPSEFATEEKIQEFILRLVDGDLNRHVLSAYSSVFTKLPISVLPSKYNSELPICQSYVMWSTELISKSLGEAVVSNDFDTLDMILSTITERNLKIVEDFLERNGERLLKEGQNGTGDKKVIILLLKGIVAKVQGSMSMALEMFEQALHSVSECQFVSRKGIVKLLANQISSDVILHKHILQNQFDQMCELDSDFNLEELSQILPELKFQEIFSLKLWWRQMTPKPMVVSKKNEEAIHKRFTTPFGRAMAYFDLSMAIGIEGKLTCYLTSLGYLLEAMNEIPLPDIYACFKIIQIYSIIVNYLANQYFGPNMRLFAHRFVLSVILKSTFIFRQKLVEHNIFTMDRKLVTTSLKTPIVDLLNKGLVGNAWGEILELIKVHPFNSTPFQSVTDQIIRFSPESMFSTSFIHARAGAKQHSLVFPKHLYSYYKFDSLWRRWGDEEVVGEFENVKNQCMLDLLQDKNWTPLDVEKVMMWPIVRRTEGGWLDNEYFDLNFEDYRCQEVFSSCGGVDINVKTGVVKLLLDRAFKENPKLFTTNDVAEIFSLKIATGHLTLENPVDTLNSHPFQEFSYSPPSLIGTDYLMTMLHADYLLKQITIGQEVNGIFPFEHRETCDGFLQRLPEDLQLKLRPIHERMNDAINSISEGAHRFWIEPGVAETVVDMKNDILTYKIGNPPMLVNTKRLRRMVSGQYVDDDSDDHKNSAEAQLAEFMTKNYDRIGSYFPILLRLRELAKISRIYKLLASKLSNDEDKLTTVLRILRRDKVLEKHKDFGNELENNVRDTLNGYRDSDWDPPHPIFTNARLESNYQKTLSLNGLVGKEHTLAPGEATRVRNEITANLKQGDEYRFKNSAEQIAGLFKISVESIHGLMRGWFDKNPKESSEMLRKCLDGKYATESSYLNLVTKEFKSIGVEVIDEESKIKLENHGECCWVPAAFCGKLRSPIDLPDEKLENEKLVKIQTAEIQEVMTEIKNKLKALTLTANSSNIKQNTKFGNNGIEMKIPGTSTAIEIRKQGELPTISSLVFKEPPELSLSGKKYERPNNTNEYEDLKHEIKTKTEELENITEMLRKQSKRSGIKPPRVYGGVVTNMGLRVGNFQIPLPRSPTVVHVKNVLHYISKRRNSSSEVFSRKPNKATKNAPPTAPSGSGDGSNGKKNDSKGKKDKPKNPGTRGKQQRLRALAEDDKLSKLLRGFLKHEIRNIKLGKQMKIRVPKEYEMAHRRGFEGAKGYDYSNTNLQLKELHKLQHKYDNYGRKNKDGGLPR